MSGQSFTTQLRTGRSPVVIADGADTIGFRVEASDIWDTVRVTARPDTAVAEVKQRVVAELFPTEHVADFVLKFRGWEILDENEALNNVGIVDGSIVLLAIRRRRPVR